MADTPEAVAERLRAFVVAVQHAAATSGGQTQVHAGPGSRPTSTSLDPTLDVCRECVDALSDDERNWLDRLIGKMSTTP